jgi:hypothetical protein
MTEATMVRPLLSQRFAPAILKLCDNFEVIRPNTLLVAAEVI